MNSNRISFVCYFYKPSRILFLKIKVFGVKEYEKLLQLRKYRIVVQHEYFLLVKQFMEQHNLEFHIYKKDIYLNRHW